MIGVREPCGSPRGRQDEGSNYPAVVHQLDWLKRQLFVRRSEKQVPFDPTEQANLSEALGVEPAVAPVRRLRICDTGSHTIPHGGTVEKMIETSTLEVAVRGVSLALLLALAACTPRSAELPPAIQADRHLMQAERQIGDGDYTAALASLDRILALQAEHALAIPDAFWFKHGQVSHEAGLHAQAVESVTRYLVAAGQGGEHYLAALELLDVAEAEAAAAAVAEREARAVAEAAAAVARGEPLEIVVLPAGRFRMGCLSGDDDCGDREKPVREVVIASFALSKHEVTFAQWDACVSGGGCGGHRPYDGGRGRAARPVVNVSWEDTQSYVSWLSRETGEEYRLPTEAEWEYAARAGTTTQYSWGNEIGVNRANCNGDLCGDRWKYTAPVGSFAANPWGLYDMRGNVWELVQDCWNGSYTGAPVDGSAWLSGDCSVRVVRGGSWNNSPGDLRAAVRGWDATGVRDGDSGFRVARTLTP